MIHESKSAAAPLRIAVNLAHRRSISALSVVGGPNRVSRCTARATAAGRANSDRPVPLELHTDSMGRWRSPAGEGYGKVKQHKSLEAVWYSKQTLGACNSRGAIHCPFVRLHANGLVNDERQLELGSTSQARRGREAVALH
jgi:hypothetical protein